MMRTVLFWNEKKTDLEEEGVEAVCSKVTVNASNSFLLMTAYISQQKRDQLEGLLKILDRCKLKR